MNVLVEDGEATIEFVDQSLRGSGLGKLLSVGGPQQVRKVTRPRVAYIVPEAVARDAGFIDGEQPAPKNESKGYDDGLPDSDWSRPALNEYAAKLEPPLNPADYSNKELLLAAIKTAIAGGAKLPGADAPA
ncbi:hypothetical protein B1R94_02320 [Mycolicibacterium litorale]|nr:hypothetical protein B1R94_02320 [Mycolicibacterium litorale]